MRYIPRLATNPLIRPADVASHSNGVSIIASILIDEKSDKSPQYSGMTLTAHWIEAYYTLLDACTHDVPEGVTGDVLYSTKRDNAIFQKEYEAIEAKISNNIFDPEMHSHSDSTIVKAADMTELLLTLDEEMELGNGFPNIRAIWFFSLVMVWRFSVKLDSDLLNTIYIRSLSKQGHIDDQLEDGVAVIAEMGLDILFPDGCVSRQWSVEVDSGSRTYSGFKGIINSTDDIVDSVLNKVDKDKRISWAILIKSKQGTKYFACRMNTNFEEKLILYHVTGPRNSTLESLALEVIPNE